MELQNYVIDEGNVVSETDLKHIQNYKQLKDFLESAMVEAMVEGKHGYRKLSSLVFDCCKNIDMLINTYEIDLAKARANNELLLKLFKEIKKEDAGEREQVEDDFKKN